MPKIYAELRQSKPFPRPEQEAVVTLLRTADAVRGRLEAALKPWGLSIEQYNALRILRGAPGGSHPTLEVAARMISRAPNITRLLDKLIAKGFVARSAAEGDRRVVRVRITPAGLRTVSEASSAVDRAEAALGRGLSRARLKALVGALDALRGGA